MFAKTWFTIVLLVVIVPFEVPIIQCIEVDAATAMGFDRRKAIPDHNTVNYLRTSDGVSISVSVQRVPAGQSLSEVWRKQTLTNAVRTIPDGGPSGMPTGVRSTHSRGPHGGDCIAMSGEYIARCTLSRAGTKTAGVITWTSSDPEGDFELIEGAVRHALARLAGRSLPGGPPRTVNRVEIRDTLRAPSGRHLVSLRRWAEARALALSMNAVLGTCSVAIGPRQLIFPLAASKVKFGAAWHDFPSAICRKGSEWYVDLDALEAIL